MASSDRRMPSGTRGFRPGRAARRYGAACPPDVPLIGGAHGKLKGDRHIVAKKEPTANLLLAIAHLYGAQIDKFGASTGRLDL